MTGKDAPVILTFLAPADRCNQRCPGCILDRTGEPVTDFFLAPEHYARFLRDLLTAGVPLQAVTFQGYEVTLPRSWPYVETVFELAKAWSVPRAFVTNGMLLHTHAESIRRLAPDRIAVSLDGAAPETNDRLRGLRGAFKATTKSLDRFLRAAESYRDRVAVMSCLYDEDNARCLRRMPSLLRSFGISRWNLAVEIDVIDGHQRPVRAAAMLSEWITPLVDAAKQEGIRCHVNDEHGFFESTPNPHLRRRFRYDPQYLIRVEPSGHVRVGHEILERWNPSTARRWDPATQNAASLVCL